MTSLLVLNKTKEDICPDITLQRKHPLEDMCPNIVTIVLNKIQEDICPYIGPGVE